MGTGGLEERNSEQGVGHGAWNSCCVIPCALEGACLKQAEPHGEEIRMGKKGTTQLNGQQKLQISRNLVFLLTLFCSRVECCWFACGLLDKRRPLETSLKQCLVKGSVYLVFLALCIHTLTVTIKYILVGSDAVVYPEASLRPALLSIFSTASTPFLQLQDLDEKLTMHVTRGSAFQHRSCYQPPLCLPLDIVWFRTLVPMFLLSHLPGFGDWIFFFSNGWAALNRLQISAEPQIWDPSSHSDCSGPPPGFWLLEHVRATILKKSRAVSPSPSPAL